MVYFEDCGIQISCRNYIKSQNYTNVKTYKEIFSWNIELNEGINYITLNETIECRKGYILLLKGENGPNRNYLRNRNPGPNQVTNAANQPANPPNPPNLPANQANPPNPTGGPNGVSILSQNQIIFGDRNIQSSQEDLKILSNSNDSLNFDSSFLLCVRLAIKNWYHFGQMLPLPSTILGKYVYPNFLFVAKRFT